MNRIERSKKIQYLLGGVFTGMGLATMLFPSEVLRHCFTKEFLALPSGSTEYPRSLVLSIQCFGSQASLCGLVILSSKFCKETYRNFGLAMIPYFVFDYYFWQRNALTNFGAIGDALGNVIFSACCYLGYQELSKPKIEDEDRAKP
jgi:hypothetical protein